MSNPRLRLIPLALLPALLAAGCGLTRGIAVRSFVPILRQSAEATYRDPDAATVEAGIPANLLLLRGLCESEPQNGEVHELAAQTYFSYALGFLEDRDPERARMAYAEGMRLGREGLSGRAWFRRAEKRPGQPDSTVLRGMTMGDVPLVFWTLANWSGWISQNLDRPEAVAELPALQAYLGRVLELRPDYFFGMPHVLAGSLLCFRPRMLGGNPEEGKKQFEEAFRISGGKMLIFRVVYAKYYCRSVLDEEGFDAALKEVLSAPPDLFPEYRLWNEIAVRKAHHLQEIRDELF